MFELDDLDYINLRIFDEKYFKQDVYLFISYSGIKHFYRIERNYGSKKDKILIHTELYETNEQIRARAKTLAEKIYSEAAVLVAEDVDENDFPGSLLEKVQLALIIYKLESERQEEENKKS